MAAKPSASSKPPHTTLAEVPNGCRQPSPGTLFRRANGVCTVRPEGTWCWDSSTKPSRVPDLDGVIAVATSGIYELRLIADGKLRWANKPQRDEDRSTPPPEPGLLATLPRIAELVDDGAGVGLRGVDGSVYQVFDKFYAPSEDVEPTLLRKVVKVPLPKPAQRLQRLRGLYATLVGGEVFVANVDEASQVTAEPLTGNPPARVVSVSRGNSHICVLADDASVWCSGGNLRGQLGIGNVDARGATFQKTALPPACAVSTVGDRNFAVLRDGSLWWWGSRSLDFSPTPKAVPGVAGVEAFTFPFALGRNGELIQLLMGPVDQPKPLRFD